MPFLCILYGIFIYLQCILLIHNMLKRYLTKCKYMLHFAEIMELDVIFVQNDIHRANSHQITKR